MPLIDLSTINSTDITFFVARNDGTCPYAWAESMRDTIGDSVKNFITIENQDHPYFASANDHEFIANLMSELVEPETETAV